MTAYIGRVRPEYHTTVRYATPAQTSYLKKLLTDNSLHTGDYDRLWKLLEVHEVDVRTPGDGTRMPFAQASASIDWVKRQVAKLPPVEAAAVVPAQAAAPEAVKYGVYQKDARVYMVVPSKKNPDRVYAKVLVESPPRMTEAGEVVDFDWDFAPNMVWKLTEADRMTLADAGKLMVKYGKCLKCKRTLKAAKTMQTVEETGVSMGATCRKYFA